MTKKTEQILNDLARLLARWNPRQFGESELRLSLSLRDDREHFEGDYPKLVQYGLEKEPECCEARFGGVQLSIRVSYNGPLQRVRISPLEADGEYPMAWHIMTFDETQWDLSPAEQDQLKTQSVSHVFSLCIWCDFFSADHTAHFLLNAMDPAGQAVQVIGVTISAEQFNRCCVD